MKTNDDNKNDFIHFFSEINNKPLPAVIETIKKDMEYIIRSEYSYITINVRFANENYYLAFGVEKSVSINNEKNRYVESLDVIYEKILKIYPEKINDVSSGGKKQLKFGDNLSNNEKKRIFKVILENTIYINKLEEAKQKYFKASFDFNFSIMDKYILIDEIHETNEIFEGSKVLQCVGTVFDSNAIEYLKLCIDRNKSKIHDDDIHTENTKKKLREYCNIMNSYYSYVDIGITMEFTLYNKTSVGSDYNNPTILYCHKSFDNDFNSSKITELNIEESVCTDISSEISVDILSELDTKIQISEKIDDLLIKCIKKYLETLALSLNKKIQHFGLLHNGNFPMTNQSFEFENVHFLNCLNGLATIIEDSKTESVIYDFGISNSDTDYIDFATSKNVKTVIISHWHYDHCKGFKGFKNTRDFLNCRWIFKNLFSGANVQAIANAVLLHHIMTGLHRKLIILDKNRTYNVDFSEKCKLFSAESKKINDSSIALYNNVENKRFLMSGDGKYNLYAMLNNDYVRNLNYLQISHHGGHCGTRTPSSPQDKAAIAVLSSGKNKYGHPLDKKMKELTKNGFEIIRTSECISGSLVSCDNCRKNTVKFICKNQIIKSIKL